MRYGSVCSGIEAATAAWHHMGWEPAFFSEIEKFPCAVLEHHYPDVPLHGDFTTIKENEYGKIDLLVGGTPCQSFSVAGLRGGLDDDRGNLALEFCRLAQREQPRWIVWENVPGVLSSNGGRDFGSILGALEDLGYGLAYRVLDAQYFGVAQRRRRVFVVGYLGDWRPAAAVLFERHSMSGHPAPSRQARQEAAGAAAAGAGGRGGDGRERPDLAGPLTAGMHKGPRGTEAVESGHVVTVGTLSCNTGPRGHDAGNFACNQAVDAGHLIVSDEPDVAGTLRTPRPGEGGVQGDFDHIVPVISPALNTQSGSRHAPDTKAYVANIYGGNKRKDRPEGGFYVKEEPTSKTLDAASGLNPTCSQGGTIVVPQAYSIMPMNSGKDYKARETDISQPLMAGGPVGGNQDQHIFSEATHEVAGTFKACAGSGGWSNSIDHAAAGYMALAPASTVRRLTPVECERLQGFPDNFTAIPWRKKGAEDCPDGPRYKALGNSMAVPVMRWIGERINLIDNLVSVL